MILWRCAVPAAIEVRHWDHIEVANGQCDASVRGDAMGRADVLLAVCATACALLAGAGGAVAVADAGDSATSESTSVGDSDSGGDQSAGDADHTDAHPYSSDDNDRTAGTQSGDADPKDTGEAQESGDEQSDEKNPADDDSGSDYGDKTINRIPVLIPEAPPFIDLGPLPEELAPLPLEPMPPVDLPPALPAAPEPDVVDVTTVGTRAALPDGNGPPVLSMPAIVAPVLFPPLHVLGASVAPRGTSIDRAVTPPSRGAAGPAPSMRHATTNERLSREQPPSEVGLTARGQLSNRSGYNNTDLRRARLAEVAAGALPGVAGIVIMTAGGICIGYRQAMAAQQLQPQGADRFLA